MKKFLSLLLAMMLVVSLAACGSSSSSSDDSSSADASSDTTEDAEDAETSSSDGAEIALICSAGSGSINDRGFFQNTYAAMEEFCEETGHTYTYYDTSENTLDALYESVDLAVQGGAEVIVTSGGDFIGYMEDLFAAYPDLYFICNEVNFTEAGDNSVIYLFEAQQAGFLAGVAAVYEGYTDIGIMCGMEIRPNQLAGYGFVQGVNYAAEVLGIEGITVKYWYTNTFETSTEVQTKAATWYEEGTQLIAAFCGGAAPSIWAAAEENDGLCMGCDIDQYYESDVIITSFLKNTNVSTMEALEAWDAGEFPGGQTINYGLAEDGVGLALEHSLMTVFDEELYDEYVEMLINDTDGLNSSIIDPDEDDAATVPEFWALVTDQYITLDYQE